MRIRKARKEGKEVEVDELDEYLDKEIEDLPLPDLTGEETKINY